MGVSGALYSGVSGLNANGNAMSVIGNNIANSNTIGFKSSRAVFGDILAGKVTASSGTVQVGRGVNLSTVDNIFTQGTFENTETNSDLAIEGPGFFIVSDPLDPNARSYTRAGAFRFDSNGNLINPEGMKVMGFLLDENGRTTGDLTPIRADTESFIAAGRTENVELNTNLDSDATLYGPPAIADSAIALDNGIIAAGGVTQAAYTDLAATPDDSVLQAAALTAATTDEGLHEDILTAIGNLQAAISSGIAADITTTATALDTAIIAAGGATQAAYTDLATTPADTTLQTAALSAAAVDRSQSQAVTSAISSLRNAIANTSFDTEDPAGTSNYATSIQVYDSLGSTHLMTTYFTKIGLQEWTWNAVVDSSELGGTPGDLSIVGSGTLNFDASGDLISISDAAGGPYELYSTPGDTNSDPIIPKPSVSTTAGSLLWANGAEQDQIVIFDMQTTQYSSPSVVVSQEQDGYGTGTLVKLSLDSEGNLIGNFSNGTPRKLMRLALAKFTNPNTLSKEGNNLYAESLESGPPVIGTVGSGVGTIFTNSLEQSNVDLAQEFVKMITTQRGFSANSKTITTTDEMLNEVINLKR